MIRWITAVLGTAPYRTAQAAQDVYRLDVRELLDREGNSPVLVHKVVEEGIRQLKEGRKVVVCCEHGMSRSNAIAAGILAAHEDIPLEVAIRRVLRATGEDSIRLEVLSTLRVALLPLAEHPARNIRPRIFVTGASGMIGTRLCSEPLPAGIAALLHTPSESLDLRRDAVPLDLTVREQGIDVIVHLAHPRVCTTNRALGEAVCMLKNVLDVCRENSTRLVYASSCEIYSGHEGTIVADERLAPRPATTLGMTKQLCENLLNIYRLESGLKATVLRFTTIYGGSTRRPAFLWDFIEKAITNEEIKTHRSSAGCPTVDLIHVSDVCRAVFTTAGAAIDGDFNLGGGHSVSTDEIARQVIEFAGSSSWVTQIPIERRLCNLTAEFRRATEMFGWVPEVSLREGITRLLAEVGTKNVATEKPSVRP